MIDEDEEGAARDRERLAGGLRRDDFAMRDAPPSRADLRHYDDPGHEARLPNPVVLDVSNTPILPADFDPLAPNPGAVRRHATGPCPRARERLPPAPAGGHHSRRLGCRSACRHCARKRRDRRRRRARSEDAAPAPAPRQEPPPRPPAAPEHRPGRGLPARRRDRRRSCCRIRRKTFERLGAATRATRQRPSANPDGARQHQG